MSDVFGRVIDRAIHPIYNAAGRNIGWYDTPQAFAAGKFTIYTSETVGPYDQLQVRTLFGVPSTVGVMENATKWLVGKGLVPAWLPAEQKARIAADAAASVPSPTDILSASPIVAGVDDRKLLMIGAGVAGVLALVLVLRR